MLRNQLLKNNFFFVSVNKLSREQWVENHRFSDSFKNHVFVKKKKYVHKQKRDIDRKAYTGVIFVFSDPKLL